MDIRAREVVRELDRHVANDGWQQPPRLFALAPADALLPGAQMAGTLSAVEQPWDSTGATLVADLNRITWPEAVLGAAVCVQRVLGGGSELRLTVAVLRDGASAAAVRHRDHDLDDAVGFGPDLAPELQAALDRTLHD